VNREEKAAVIDQVATQIQESEAIYAIDYRGISVTQVAELRSKLAEADASLRVVKNSLTERAADQAGAEHLKDHLEGPTAFTFVRGDAALAAKAIANFRKEYELLSFKGGVMAGEILTVEQIEDIAKLPARDVLDGRLVGILASPVTGLVNGLNNLIQGLALQLGQMAEQGLVSGEPPAEAEAPAAEAEEPAAEAEEPAAEADEPAAEAEAETDEPQAEAETDDAPSEGETEEEG